MSSLIATAGKEPWRRRLLLPAYQLRDAARYADTPTQTVSYWFRGHGRRATLPNHEKRTSLSYLELAEVAFVAAMRKIGVSLQRIRRAREYAAQELTCEFPFAQYEFKTDGMGLMFKLKELDPTAEEGKLVVADRHGQLAWESLLQRRFEEFDYENNLAVRWHPIGRDKPVVIDPQIAFGAPTIDGVPTWAIRGRVEAGETIKDIAYDFSLDEKQVNEALKFEGMTLH
jgi:uncharacterized protein (DUF433 family)